MNNATKGREGNFPDENLITKELLGDLSMSDSFTKKLRNPCWEGFSSGNRLMMLQTEKFYCFFKLNYDRIVNPFLFLVNLYG